MIMNLLTHPHPAALTATLDDIIKAHGLWPVLRALVARLLRRRDRVPPLALSDHLRRDIGLATLPPPVFPPGPQRW